MEKTDKQAGGLLPKPELARRRFLMGSMGLVGGAAAGLVPGVSATGNNLPPNVPAWTRSLGSGVLTNPYGQPSPFESNVQRRTVDWLTPDRTASIIFTPLADLKGIIIPSGVAFERYHAGLPAIEPAEHRLMIHGMVGRPLIFTMEDLMKFASSSVIRFLECW